MVISKSDVRLPVAAKLSLLIVLVGLSLSGRAQAPVGAGITRTPLLENDRINAIKLSLAPGARESIHTHPFDIVVIQLTAGEAEFLIAGKKTAGHVEPGQVTYVPALAPHSVANVGNTSADVAVVALK